MIICALRAPASLNASRIAIKSALLVPIALIASTMSDNVVPVSKTKAETFSAPADISELSFVTGSVVFVTVVLAF